MSWYCMCRCSGKMVDHFLIHWSVFESQKNKKNKIHDFSSEEKIDFFFKALVSIKLYCFVFSVFDVRKDWKYHILIHYNDLLSCYICVLKICIIICTNLQINMMLECIYFILNTYKTSLSWILQSILPTHHEIYSHTYYISMKLS